MTNIKRDFIFLPGSIRTASYYQEFINTLRQSPLCNDILVIEYPGFGEYQGMPSPWTIPQFVKHVRTHYAQYELAHNDVPKTVIGHSLGASVAFAWANQEESRFSEYVLINTAIGTFNPIFRSRFSIFKMGLAQLFLNPKQLDAYFISHTVNSMRTRTELLTETKQKERQPINILDCTKQVLAAALYYPFVITTKANGLILCSEKDRLLSVRNSKSLAKYLNIPIHTHPSAGHELCQEAPEFCVEKITAFITNTAHEKSLAFSSIHHEKAP